MQYRIPHWLAYAFTLFFLAGTAGFVYYLVTGTSPVEFLSFPDAGNALFYWILAGCVLGIILLLRWRYPDSFLLIWKDIRPLRILHYVVMAVIGAAVYIRFGDHYPVVEKTFPPAEMIPAYLLVPVAIGLAAVFAIVVNNIEDVVIDRISNPDRPLVRGLVSRERYLATGIGCLFAGLILASFIHPDFFLMLVMISAGYFFYSSPPLKLKRIPIIAKLIIGCNSWFMALAGYSLTGGEISDFPVEFSFFILVPLSLAGNFIDIKDYEGDKAAGISTLPVLFGPRPARWIIGFFTLTTYLTFYLILRIDWIWIILLPPALIHFWLLVKPRYQEKYVFVTYLNALLGIIGILLIF